MGKQAKSGDCKTAGRAKRKREGHNKPLSLYVRGKISAERYFKATATKRKGLRSLS